MKVIIDINHPAHINFYKYFINELDKLKVDLVFTVLRRGKLEKIAKKELPNKKIYFCGKHNGGFLSVIFQANFLKFFELLLVIFKEKPTIGFGGGYLLGAALKLFGKKNYQFDDDPERKLMVLLQVFTATKVYFPPIVNFNNNKIVTYNALKEWSYLSPQYFSPDESVLHEFNVLKGQFIFVREISSGSLNYINQAEGKILSFANELPTDIVVLLSLENKDLKDKFPSNWIVLQEPVSDIHSLIFYSKMVISSGDSMAREGAMLGVPSIYCGIREMKANNILINKGMLFKCLPKNVPTLVNDIFLGKCIIKAQSEFRKSLHSEWIDVTKLLLSLINPINLIS
jgi:uncharacterized protein